MKIALIEKTSNRAVNKDQMGGYGIDTQAGDSLLTRFIMRQKKNMRNIPVLSLAYMAAIFSRDGHEVTLLNDGETQTADLFIIASSIVDYSSELAYASMLKDKFPGAKVGFIGPFAGFLSEEYLKYGDFIIKGEPEQAAIEISKRRIPAERIIESTSPEDLDELPFPGWEVFDVGRYSYSPSINSRPLLTMQASRGCAFSCNYCPYLTYQKKWRPRKIRRVIEEISYLKDRFNIKGLLFRDPLFTLNKDRSKELSEEMAKNFSDIEWACETRPDLLDEDLVDMMHRAGLKAINLGIESPRKDVLDKASRKAVDLDYQERIVRYCEKKGIKVIAFYILGLPDDTPESLKDTFKYAEKLNSFIAQFHVFTPFPGTEAYSRLESDIIEKDWRKFNSFTPVMRHKNLSPKKLSLFKDRAFTSYYFRSGYILKHYRYLLPLWKQLTGI